jgi:hypothetical protein
MEIDWRAAGILPYAVVDDGEIMCLLGQEFALAPHTHRIVTRGGRDESTSVALSAVVSDDHVLAAQPARYRSWWSDFGGGREPSDRDAEHTAAREFSEETLGLFGDGRSLDTRVSESTSSMRRTLVAQQLSGRAVIAAVHDTYVMYCCPVSHVDSLMFQLARDANDSQLGELARSERTDSLLRRCGEKRDFAWVPLRTLGQAVAAGRLRVRTVDGQQITLLPRLAYALRVVVPALASMGGAATSAAGISHRLQVLPPRHGKCLYLSESPQPARGASLVLPLPVLHTGGYLSELIAHGCPLFGCVEHATVYRQATSAFALVSFKDAIGAGNLHSWIARQQGSHGGEGHGDNDDPPASSPACRASVVAAAKHIRAEFAFFEPTVGRASGGGGTHRRKDGRANAGSGQGDSDTLAGLSCSQGEAKAPLSGQGGAKRRRAAERERAGQHREQQRPNTHMSSRGRRRLLGVCRPSNACLH